MSGERVLRIAVPGLADAVGRLVEGGGAVRLPAAEWLLSRGRRSAADVARWREWLLDGAGLGPDVLARFPAGPCAASAMRGQRPAGAWARAEPVHLLTALDHLQLGAPVPLHLDASESADLLATLNDHLAGSGFVLHAQAGSGWLCECPPDLEFAAAEPWTVVGQNLRELLPTGRDAGRVRAMVNELQMLLHEHPVNERRIARGLPTANSVWLWGAGTLGRPAGSAPGMLLTDDAWLAALWRMHGGHAPPLDGFPLALEHGGEDVRVASLLATDERDVIEDLQWIESAILAPARASLVAGGVNRIALHAGRSAFEIPAGARWTFWRRARPLAEVLA